MFNTIGDTLRPGELSQFLQDAAPYAAHPGYHAAAAYQSNRKKYGHLEPVARTFISHVYLVHPEMRCAARAADQVRAAEVRRMIARELAKSRAYLCEVVAPTAPDIDRGAERNAGQFGVLIH